MDNFIHEDMYPGACPVNSGLHHWNFNGRCLHCEAEFDLKVAEFSDWVNRFEAHKCTGKAVLYACEGDQFSFGERW